MLKERLSQKLRERHENKLYRTRRVREAGLSFSNNDYLGLATHADVKKAFNAAVSHFGVGSTSSPLLSGYCHPHRELEETVADFLGFERALIYACGYMSNLGVASALCARHDTIFLDRICHASMLDAIKLSGAKLKRYPHMDMLALEKALAAHKGNAWVISEGVFGMDGDLAPAPTLSALARQYGAGVILDDAHGFGILGQQGRGILSHYGLSSDSVDAYCGTFGKALGGFGAFVAADEAVIDTLVQYSRPYMFSTAMPPAIAASAIAGIQVLQKETWRHAQLQSRIQYFSKKALEYQLPVVLSETPIQLVMLNDAGLTDAVGKALLAENISVSVIRPPTVPDNTARLRISLNLVHTEADIDRLLGVLSKLLCSLGFSPGLACDPGQKSGLRGAECS